MLKLGQFKGWTEEEVKGWITSEYGDLYDLGILEHLKPLVANLYEDEGKLHVYFLFRKDNGRLYELNDYHKPDYGFENFELHRVSPEFILSDHYGSDDESRAIQDVVRKLVERKNVR